jgi:hypothetical protein
VLWAVVVGRDVEAVVLSETVLLAMVDEVEEGLLTKVPITEAVCTLNIILTLFVQGTYIYVYICACEYIKK